MTCDYAFSVTSYAFPIQRALRLTRTAAWPCSSPSTSTPARRISRRPGTMPASSTGAGAGLAGGQADLQRTCRAGDPPAPPGAGYRHARGLAACRMAVQGLAGPAAGRHRHERTPIPQRLQGQVVAFRADASLEIGSGHVMRCLTLAEALQAQGAECHFLCREHPGHLCEVIEARGFTVHRLPLEENTAETDTEDNPEPELDHAHWLGARWAQDAAACRRSWPNWPPPGWWWITTPWIIAGKRRCLMGFPVQRRACW
jgi:hypothetical protein